MDLFSVVFSALKIYEHTERTSAMLTIKEIQIPSTTDSKDAGLMTSILSFEPSGVVFSDDSVDGELSSGDYITVTTPTVLTWDANWTLDVDEVSDALSVVWKENEGDDVWQTCRYGKDFNGIIDISEKNDGTRIIATYALKHFTLFSLMRWIPGMPIKQVYALCAMSEDDRNKDTYSIQCSICYEHPEHRGWFDGDLCSTINDDYYIAVEIIPFDAESDIIPANFIFNEYHSSDHNYHLTPFEMDSQTVFVNVIEWKYKYIKNFAKQNGFYRLKKGSHDEGIRTRIKIETNKNKDTKRNELKICGVNSVILLSLYFIISTFVFI